MINCWLMSQSANGGLSYEGKTNKNFIVNETLYFRCSCYCGTSEWSYHHWQQDLPEFFWLLLLKF